MTVLSLPTRPARKIVKGAGQVCLAAIGLTLGAVAILALLGLRPLVVMSGSMTPALLPGDAILARGVAPLDVRVGDVVTFTDPSRGGAHVTHRVVSKVREGDGWSFVTKGDANTAVERWSYVGGERLQRFVVRIPRVGYLAGPLRGPVVRSVLLACAGVIFLGRIVRRIWMS